MRLAGRTKLRFKKGQTKRVFTRAALLVNAILLGEFGTNAMLMQITLAQLNRYAADYPLPPGNPTYVAYDGECFHIYPPPHKQVDIQFQYYPHIEIV
jgi:hypothetical protein